MNLTKDDLIQKCKVCDGEGWIYDPPRNSNQGSYGTHQVAYQHKQSCGACHMTGETFTETGEAIASLISLMKRQGRL
jgi:DnaJ-class molecular chaperone